MVKDHRYQFLCSGSGRSDHQVHQVHFRTFRTFIGTFIRTTRQGRPAYAGRLLRLGFRLRHTHCPLHQFRGRLHHCYLRWRLSRASGSAAPGGASPPSENGAGRRHAGPMRLAGSPGRDGRLPPLGAGPVFRLLGAGCEAWRGGQSVGGRRGPGAEQLSVFAVTRRGGLQGMWNKALAL